MASSVGITGYGAYVPYWRLKRAAVAASLGTGGGKGTRAVASYDEDTTTLGVEAARLALRGRTVLPATLFFSTMEAPVMVRNCVAELPSQACPRFPGTTE